MNAGEGKLAELRERPPSPCINVCRLDERGLCTGCLRSGAEIARWMGMSAQKQWQLLGVVEARRNLSKQVT